jgi:D-3-phosphoglycerate dehydrogenase
MHVLVAEHTSRRSEPGHGDAERLPIIERCPLDELFARADVISLHCPHTPETEGLIDREAFHRMKPGVLLVNCARGPIIDRAALEDALAAGRLGGLGLDVYWEEPWDPDDPLWARPDVVTLPHVGGSTVEAQERIASIVAENVRRALVGEELLHRIA